MSRDASNLRGGNSQLLPPLQLQHISRVWLYEFLRRATVPRKKTQTESAFILREVEGEAELRTHSIKRRRMSHVLEGLLRLQQRRGSLREPKKRTESARFSQSALATKHRAGKRPRPHMLLLQLRNLHQPVSSSLHSLRQPQAVYQATANTDQLSRSSPAPKRERIDATKLTIASLPPTPPSLRVHQPSPLPFSPIFLFVRILSFRRVLVLSFRSDRFRSDEAQKTCGESSAIEGLLYSNKAMKGKCFSLRFDSKKRRSEISGGRTGDEPRSPSLVLETTSLRRCTDRPTALI